MKSLICLVLMDKDASRPFELGQVMISTCYFYYLSSYILECNKGNEVKNTPTTLSSCSSGNSFKYLRVIKSELPSGKTTFIERSDVQASLT